MATTFGTAGNDSWTVIKAGTFTLDGLGGTDTLYLGTSLRSDYQISKASDGSVHIDSVSGASAALHATLHNMETLVFNNKRDVLDLATYFGSTTPAYTGTAGNDVFNAPSTTITYDGLAGIDTVNFSKARAAYVLTPTATGFTVSDGVAADQLRHVERLGFADGSKLALDLDGHAGLTAKILGAVFSPSAVANQNYVGIGLNLLDSGMSYDGLMQLALDTALGPNASHRAVVELLYTNVVGVAPSASEAATYVNLLDNGSYTPAALGVMAADLGLNGDHIGLVGLAATGLAFS